MPESQTLEDGIQNQLKHLFDRQIKDQNHFNSEIATLHKETLRADFYSKDKLNFAQTRDLLKLREEFETLPKLDDVVKELEVVKDMIYDVDAAIKTQVVQKEAFAKWETSHLAML